MDECVTNGDMTKTRFTASLRTRVTKETKLDFERLARKRRVKEAALQREALEDFIDRNRKALAV